MKVSLAQGYLVLSIKIESLAVAASHCPLLEDGSVAMEGYDGPNIKITNPRVFGSEVGHYLTREREDGSSLISDALDKAFFEAVEQGCEGVDHEWVPSPPKVEYRKDGDNG